MPCGSSPSPLSNGVSSVELTRPYSVCQALVAAGARSESMRSSGSLSVCGPNRRIATR